MCDTSECRRVVEETIKQLGGIDVIISNAVSTYVPLRLQVHTKQEHRGGRASVTLQI